LVDLKPINQSPINQSTNNPAQRPTVQDEQSGVLTLLSSKRDIKNEGTGVNAQFLAK
jgi:hypothetical protein